MPHPLVSFTSCYYSFMLLPFIKMLLSVINVVTACVSACSAGGNSLCRGHLEDGPILSLPREKSQAADGMWILINVSIDYGSTGPWLPDGAAAMMNKLSHRDHWVFIIIDRMYYSFITSECVFSAEFVMKKLAAKVIWAVNWNSARQSSSTHWGLTKSSLKEGINNGVILLWFHLNVAVMKTFRICCSLKVISLIVLCLTGLACTAIFLLCNDLWIKTIVHTLWSFAGPQLRYNSKDMNIFQSFVRKRCRQTNHQESDNIRIFTKFFLIMLHVHVLKCYLCFLSSDNLLWINLSRG